MPAVMGHAGEQRNEISGYIGRFGKGDICDALTAAEKRFRDRSGTSDGVSE